MKILLIVGIPTVFAIGYCIYLVHRFIKAVNDSDWQDYQLPEFDDIDIFHGDEKDK